MELELKKSRDFTGCGKDFWKNLLEKQVKKNNKIAHNLNFRGGVSWQSFPNSKNCQFWKLVNLFHCFQHC